MGLMSMCCFTYGHCHVFWQLLVTTENDDVSTKWKWLWYSSLSLVYGSYEHKPFYIRAFSRFLTTAGYYRKWWCINKIDYNIHHWAWYMGLTSMCRFIYGNCHVFWQLLVTTETDDVSTKWLWYSSLSLVYGYYKHMPFLAVVGYSRNGCIALYHMLLHTA